MAKDFYHLNFPAMSQILAFHQAVVASTPAARLQSQSAA